MLGAALPSAVSCIGAGYGQWGREPPIGVGKLPAPMAGCLLQRAVSIALLPAPVACCLLQCRRFHCSVACPGGLLPAPMACCLPRCWPAFARDRAGLVGAPGRSSVMRSAVVRAGARAVLQAKSRSRRGAPACRVDVRAVLHVVRDDGEAVNSPIGLVFGLFCMRSGTFKGISSLCKCDSAYKVWWCWESRAAVQSSPAAADADPGIAVKAAHGAERLGLCARGLRGTAGNWARCRSRIRGAGALQWGIAAEGTPVAGSR